MEALPRITPIILAGGRGERLWPLSRQDYPKQLLSLLNDTSLLQDTAANVHDPRVFDAPLIICNDAIRFIVAEQLDPTPPQSIVIEPVGRNTAPAVAVAALMLHARNPDAMMLVMPSDLTIGDKETFQRMVLKGAVSAQRRKLVIFGVTPDTPHTGYGYIRRGTSFAEGEGAFAVESFVEKPDRATAERYLASGEYAWNSGMYLMSAALCLEEFERHAPDILLHATRALEYATADLQFLRLDAEHFAACPDASIDYAITEKTSNAVVVPASIAWSDLGTWGAVWRASPQDGHDNACQGDVVAQDCTGNYLRSDGKLLACIGLESMIVVNTPDATLVAPMDRVQDIKNLTQVLKAQERREIIDNTVVFRPWGSYTTLVNQPGFQVKRILVKCGGKLSMQSHHHRSEHWVVVRGTAKVICGEREFMLHENESTFIPMDSKHRLENPGKIPLELIEVQVGSYLGEDDITRYDDAYQRK